MLITIDGPDFAGKSTIIAALSRALAERGYRVCLSRTSLTRGWMVPLVEWAQRPSIPAWIKSLVFHAAYLPDLFWRVPRDTVFLQETYWPRVLAYDVVAKRRVGYLFMRAIGWMMPKPDVGVFIDSRFGVRKRRYQHSPDQSDQRDARRFGPDRAFHTRLIAVYKTLSRRHGAIVMKNNHEDVQVVVAQILAQVERGRRPR
ncbi:hypothetical protein [Burkholderia gladioli]|uniref:hypothetical protein n=1 Tax=Burkholderia gladioli TaxID=28095 RepID=UPI000BBD03BD|nr:hypothetical protein [Burkholderia gladioli]ATF87803.1 hypothetical protein CO712_22210 [Burkholderia gladioli pv. gladioli]MBJ9713161.1 hypothetical protein [Burkholderia gladioli]MBU9155041.1 hypothetical protein [Burkholderia gladioli]MCH7271381.1 hypothetical protein [Burkholderia gladioli]MDR8092198.1 hypothetical protein [Burkholderia gladioli]